MITGMHPTHARLLSQFGYRHLPQPMQSVSKIFYDAAHALMAEVERRRVEQQEMDGPDVTVALRKLLEAKDAAVRATL